MIKFDKSSKILLGVLVTLMVSGCSSKSSKSDVEDDNLPVVECNASIPESGIHFDITGVNYAEIRLDDSNASLSEARQLAAQCAQCHGTFGVALGDTVENWPSLWGKGRGIAKAMKDYNSTDYAYSAMHIHSSMTYSQEQIKLIQAYYENIAYTGGE